MCQYNKLDLLAGEILYYLEKANEYEKLAAKVYQMLEDAWQQKSADAVVDVYHFLMHNKGSITDKELEHLMQILDYYLGELLAEDLKMPMYNIALNTYKLPYNELGVKFVFHKKNLEVLKWLKKTDNYFIRDFFNSQLSDKIKSSLIEIVSEGAPRTQAAARLRDTLTTQLTPKTTTLNVRQYFGGVANNFITRARSSSQVQAYDEAGVTKYQISAVIDDRTSEICRQMDGKVFELEEGLKLRDKYISTPANKIKDTLGWVKPDNIDKTPKYKLSLPPYHFNCRTRTIIYRD
jgi:SPP1 gp7 family putative phage head morphogenesis protein